MQDRKQEREVLGLTQTEAAARAEVSLATWRRWEEDPSSVGQSTRAKCERVLEKRTRLTVQLEARAANFEKAWGSSTVMTPRQASAIAGALDFWADADIQEWLRDPTGEPLHGVPPFASLDVRVMIHVNENRAWAEKARERCYAVSKEIESGLLPFDRPGCFFDELLMAMALPEAETKMKDMPELFDEVAPRPPRESSDLDDGYVADDDWDLVSDNFDNVCRWDEWEVPLFQDHPLLGIILSESHPFTWFDPSEGSGAGYLQRLVGLVRES